MCHLRILYTDMVRAIIVIFGLNNNMRKWMRMGMGMPIDPHTVLLRVGPWTIMDRKRRHGMVCMGCYIRSLPCHVSVRVRDSGYCMYH